LQSSGSSEQQVPADQEETPAEGAAPEQWRWDVEGRAEQAEAELRARTAAEDRMQRALSIAQRVSDQQPPSEPGPAPPVAAPAGGSQPAPGPGRVNDNPGTPVKSKSKPQQPLASANSAAPDSPGPSPAPSHEEQPQDYTPWFPDFAAVFASCAAENPNAEVVRGGFASGKRAPVASRRRRDRVTEAEAAAARVRQAMGPFAGRGAPVPPALVRQSPAELEAARALADAGAADGSSSEDDVVGEDVSLAAVPVPAGAAGEGEFRVPFRGSKMALLRSHAARLGAEERARREALGLPAPPTRLFRVLPAGRAEVYHLVRLALEQASGGGWAEAPATAGNDACWHLYWSWGKPKVVRANLLTVQRFNHFRHARELTRKDLLKKNLSRYQCLGGRMARAFGVLPPTFVLPKEYLAFAEAFGRAAYRGGEASETGGAAYGLVGAGTGMGAAGSSATLAARAAMMLAGPPKSGAASVPAGADDNVWILKPVGLSRGRGISMVREISDVTYGTPCVLQKYVGDTMLLDGYKFDLRVYVLVTSFSPLEAFVYEKGFARVSSVPYSRQAASTYDKAMHLTNSSLQKDAADKGSAVAAAVREGEGGGTKVSLDYLWQRLHASGVDAARCWRRVKEVLVKSLVCVDDVIPHQPNCFELYGYDVLLDAAGKAHLIEVNSSPSLGVDSDLDTRVKLGLVRDIARVVDPLPFHHGRLVETLDARAAATARCRSRPRHHSAGLGLAAPSGALQSGVEQAALNRDLSRVFGGALPREYGVQPQDAGHFSMICPGSDAYKKVLRLKLSHLAGGRARQKAADDAATRTPFRATETPAAMRRPPLAKAADSAATSASLRVREPTKGATARRATSFRM